MDGPRVSAASGRLGPPLAGVMDYQVAAMNRAFSPATLTSTLLIDLRESRHARAEAIGERQERELRGESCRQAMHQSQRPSSSS